MRSRTPLFGYWILLCHYSTMFLELGLITRRAQFSSVGRTMYGGSFGVAHIGRSSEFVPRLHTEAFDSIYLYTMFLNILSVSSLNSLYQPKESRHWQFELKNDKNIDYEQNQNELVFHQAYSFLESNITHIVAQNLQTTHRTSSGIDELKCLIISPPIIKMQTFQVLYTHKQPWVSTYDYKRVPVTKPQFHYFTSDQEGFTKVNLLIKEEHDICTMDMYYQQTDNFHRLAITYDRQRSILFSPDDSGLVDLSELQPPPKRSFKINSSDLRTSLWVEKYTPKCYTDLLTDEYLNRTVLLWTKSWDPVVFKKKKKNYYKPQVKHFPLFGSKNNFNNQNQTQENGEAPNTNRLLLLAGPPGCGKTTLARVIAQHCGYNYVQINASDNRSAKTLIARLEQMTNNESVTANHKPTLIILDQVDGVLESQSNGMKEILNYIETGQIPGETKKQRANKKHNAKEEGMYIKRPILFICNDPYTKGLKQLRAKARVLQFGKIKTDMLYQCLKKISNAQRIGLNNEEIMKVCQLNQNDIRSSVSMMEFIAKNVGQQVTPKQILAQVVWEKKQTTKTLVEFLEEILSRRQKNKSIEYKKVLDKLFSVDVTPNLILEGFFGNYRNCKAIYHNSQHVPRLLDAICESDGFITNSFGYNFELNGFLPLPYLFFKIYFRGEQYCKIQYPFAFFERLSRQKANKQIICKLLNGVSPYVRPFISARTMLLDYGPALYSCIQPCSTQEKDIINCIKLMINYGITFSDYTQSVYNPEIDKLFQSLQAKPQLNLVSNATRLTMSSHYKEVKENMAFQSQKIDIKRTIITKDKKTGKAEDGIQYKFLQGTGTEIEYAITMQYFI